MRKNSLTSFIFVAVFAISMSVTSESHAQSFSQGAGGSGAAMFPTYNGSQRITGVVGSPARTAPRPAAKPPAQQQQQSGSQTPSENYDAFGNVIHAGEQTDAYGNVVRAETQSRPMNEAERDHFNQANAEPQGSGLAFPDTRGDENGVPVGGSNPNYSNEGRGRDSGAERAAYCGRPGVTCDEEGNTLVSNPDGSTTLTNADGTTKTVPASGTTKEQACIEAASTARSACLMPGTGGMDEGTAAMFSMMMTVQLPAMVSQISSIGKNMSQQCQVQADISKIMATINGVKGAACATTISSCKTACTEEATYQEGQATQHGSNTATVGLVTDDKKKMAAAKRSGATCTGYTGQVMGMMMSAMQSGVSAVANKQCASDLAAFNNAAPTYTPPAITQIGGCEDPNNQTLACYCTRPGNATSAMCSGFTGGGIAGGGTTTTPNGSTVASPYASTVPDTGDGNTVDPFANPAKKSGDGKGPGDGGSGAPGGGGLASFGSEGGGSGAGGTPLSAITGTSGGTGSGLGGAGGGGGGGLARNNGKAAGGGSLMDRFNLKRFLPGSKYKTRGIAGMSVKSVDGITGPMGPSLFEKATRQYQEQIQKQSVILDK